jgi:hypothetical protein
MSAMTAISADENDPRCQLDVVDAFRRGGSKVTADISELWRRRYETRSPP